MMSVTWRICLYSSTIVYPPFCPFSELSTSKKGEVDNGEGVMGTTMQNPYTISTTYTYLYPA